MHARLPRVLPDVIILMCRHSHRTPYRKWSKTCRNLLVENTPMLESTNELHNALKGELGFFKTSK